MTRPTILDSENVALLDLTPSGRAKPAWAAAAEKVVAQQMASLTASVMRRAGDDDTAWDDVRKYVEGLERERDELRWQKWATRHTDTMNDMASLRIANDAAEARIAELETALDEKEVAAGLTSDGNMWRFWSTKASTLAVRNAELEKRLADASRVIEPFAPIAAVYDGHEDSDPIWAGFVAGVQKRITVGHLRAARAYREGK